MRTTLTIDDDVLAAARGLAARQCKSVGQIISDLSRQALQPAVAHETTMRNGIALLPRRAGAPVVTLALVNQLRDESA